MLQLVAGLYTRLGHRVADEQELRDMMEPLDIAGLERALQSQIAEAAAARPRIPPQSPARQDPCPELIDRSSGAIETCRG